MNKRRRYKAKRRRARQRRMVEIFGTEDPILASERAEFAIEALEDMLARGRAEMRSGPNGDDAGSSPAGSTT